MKLFWKIFWLFAFIFAGAVLYIACDLAISMDTEQHKQTVLKYSQLLITYDSPLKLFAAASALLVMALTIYRMRIVERQYLHAVDLQDESLYLRRIENFVSGYDHASNDWQVIKLNPHVAAQMIFNTASESRDRRVLKEFDDLIYNSESDFNKYCKFRLDPRSNDVSISPHLIINHKLIEDSHKSLMYLLTGKRPSLKPPIDQQYIRKFWANKYLMYWGVSENYKNYIIELVQLCQIVDSSVGEMRYTKSLTETRDRSLENIDRIVSEASEIVGILSKYNKMIEQSITSDIMQKFDHFMPDVLIIDKLKQTNNTTNNKAVLAIWNLIALNYSPHQAQRLLKKIGVDISDIDVRVFEAQIKDKLEAV